MGRRIIALAAALLFVAAPAVAQVNYPPLTGGLQLSSSRAAQGDPLEVKSPPNTFAGDSEVTLTMESTPVEVGTATAASDGSLNATVTVPRQLEDGTHKVVAAGVSSTGAPVRVESAVTIGAAPVSSTASDDGGSSGMLLVVLAIVGVVIAVGIAIAASNRRRGGEAVTA